MLQSERSASYYRLTPIKSRNVHHRQPPHDFTKSSDHYNDRPVESFPHLRSRRQEHIKTTTVSSNSVEMLKKQNVASSPRLSLLSNAAPSPRDSRVIVEHIQEANKFFAEIEFQDTKRWSTAHLDAIAKQLGTDVENGLESKQVSRLLAEHGPNELEPELRTPIHIVFLLQFYNLIIGMLLFAAVTSLSLQEYVEGFAILFIVTLNAVIATIQENSASNALEVLVKMSSPQSTVIRGGVEQMVDSNQLVPGDIVLLKAGDVVPADIRLCDSVDLKSNEMLLTGESEDVSKKLNASVSGKSNKLTPDNMVFSSTTITTGNARGIVRSLHKLSFVMSAIALSVCALVFVVGIMQGTRDAKHPERPVWLTMTMISVSLAVSAVPEGLPMVVTICLSTGTSDMVKKNVLVRKLAAVETLGAASLVCTDKTGTLTEGKMTAIKLCGDFKDDNIQVRSTLLASVCCSNTHLKQVDVDGVATWQSLGSSSEAPLIVAAAKAGIWEDYVKEDYNRVVEVPFTSSRKMMVTVHSLPPTRMFGTLSLEPKAEFVACVKVAPNFILDNCTQFCKMDGTISPLSDTERKAIAEAVDNLSSQALRVIAVAINPLIRLPYAVDCDNIDKKFAALSKPLVFLGLVASIDSERDGVREAIGLARKASIRLPEDRGQYLPPADIDEITSRALVFARAKPEDKLEIVKSLNDKVSSAMTGDGVNDTPALEADIGVAMGIAGTEVAKGASDMLLTDENFVTSWQL
ncbi:unnamed protein product [Phytophthora lilii]|uniref:Unnamed protein product n=1 Tax=Phytophthora lilii TaxID=2077276 RepID=A0A9W6TGD4_9STRA|nr:unnamed protein product [Phytophthora lilii]